MIGGVLIATIADKLAYKSIRARGSPTLYFIIASMGMAILIDNLIIATIGPRFRSYPQIFKVTSIDVGGVTISTMDLVAAAIAAVMLVILVFIINKTKQGIAIRAASYDLDAIGLMGVNTNLLISIVFFIAGSLAGLAGFFLGMKYTVYPTLGSMITNKAYVAAVFGGLGSLPGAVIGSILLGIFEMMISGYVSSSARDIFVYLLLIIILLYKPTGILGVKREDKV
jgi:branched-chain amino acid transport system permease protein